MWLPLSAYLNSCVVEVPGWMVAALCVGRGVQLIKCGNTVEQVQQLHRRLS
jgi:hypothetical protein